MPASKDAPPSGWSEHRFISFDKTAIFYRSHGATGVSRGNVLIVHGMGEHSGRYRELGEALVAAGMEVTALDLRGFGQSGGKKGCLNHFEDYFIDLEVTARLMKQRHPHLPLFLLGHSFGGLIASAWLARDTDNRARGLVLTSPNFGIAIHVPVWRQALAVIASYVAPNFTQDNRVEADFLTHDKVLREKSKVDRLSHHRISARLYHELILQLDRKNEIASSLKLPVLILQAGDDRVVSKEDALDFFQHLAIKDKQIEVFPELYHEILNETVRKDIYTKIIAWISQRA